MTSDINPFVGPRWCIEASKLAQSKTGQIDATPDERAAAAKELDLLECRSLSLGYTLKAMGAGTYRLQAGLIADVVQACIVTLEPVELTSRETVDIELRPAENEPPVPAGDTIDVLAEVVSETYAEGRIDLGQLAFELLSVSIDPYPRKPGVAFDDVAEVDKSALSPFAVLAKLKP